MSLVVPASVGEILMLHYITGLVNAGNPVVHLFSNDVTPTNSTSIGDLVQVSSTGYAPITLVSSNWTTTQLSGVTTAVHSERTFSFGTSMVAYGYYVTTQSNQLLWLERFSGAPFSIPPDGGSVTIGANLTLS